MKATNKFDLKKEEITTELVDEIMERYPSVELKGKRRVLFAVLSYISGIDEEEGKFYMDNANLMYLTNFGNKTNFLEAIKYFVEMGWIERVSGYRITGDRKASEYRFIIQRIKGTVEGYCKDDLKGTVKGTVWKMKGTVKGAVDGYCDKGTVACSTPYTYTYTESETNKEKDVDLLNTIECLRQEKEKNKKEIEMLKALIAEQAEMIDKQGKAIDNLNSRIDKSANLFTSMRQEIDNLRASVQGRGEFSKKEDSFISSSFQSQSDGARINEIITSMENDEVRQKDLKYILAQRDERKIPHTLYAPFMAALGKLQSKYANWFVDGASDFFDANINRVVAETDLTGISTEDEDAILRVLGEILKPFSVRCNTVYIILNGRENRDKVSEYLQQYYARTYDMIIKRVASPKNVEEGVATEKDLTLCYTDEPF